MASFRELLLLLPVALACAPQKADYVVVSCFPNAIIANVPECPYGWEIEQLSLGGVCYTGIHSGGYYRFIIPDLTPRNHSYCGTQSEYMPGKDPKYIFFNSIVSNDTSLTIRNQPVNYTFSCMYRAAYLVNNAVFSQRVATVYVNNGSLGTFRSQLSLNVFTNSKFLYAKDAPYVIDTSEIGSEVFIGIEAKGLSNRFKVVINNCWATPTPFSTDKKRWSLIINSCPADNTVTIFDNAKDSRSTFKFNSFRFQRLEKVSTVWLHCEVQICDGERLFCQPSPCSVRSLSSEVEPGGGILTAEFQIKDNGSSNNGQVAVTMAQLWVWPAWQNVQSARLATPTEKKQLTKDMSSQTSDESSEEDSAAIQTCQGTSLLLLLLVLTHLCCDFVNGLQM